MENFLIPELSNKGSSHLEFVRIHPHQNIVLFKISAEFYCLQVWDISTPYSVVDSVVFNDGPMFHYTSIHHLLQEILSFLAVSLQDTHRYPQMGMSVFLR
jgi:hypothetical protein